MPIDFPASPTLNQTYTYGDRTWKWNSEGWQLQFADSGPAGGYTPSTTAVNKTLTANEFCVVTASGKTITLPATPAVGTQVAVGVQNFADTVLARNGSNIMALAQDVTLDVPNSSYEFIYVDSTRGWFILG